MTWLFFTLISVLFVSIAAILQRVLMKGDKSDPYSYAVVFQLLIAILSLPLIALYGFELPTFSSNLVFFFIAAAFWAGAGVFNFKALKLIEASEVTIVSTIRVLVTIAAAIFFLGESFNGVKIVGTILIIVAVILITNLKKGFKFNKGFVYTLVMALCAGLAIVADGINVKNYGVVSSSIIVNSLIVIILLLLRPKSLRNWKHFITPNFLKKMLPLGIFSTTQGVAYLFALATPGVTAQVGTIRQASVIITVILAVLFLKEKDYLIRKFIAAVLVTIGVISLS